MKKVVYSVTRIGKTNSTFKGIGYLTDTDLVIALNSKKNAPYIKVFEDITKYCHPVVNSKDEFKGAYYEIAEVMVTRPDGSQESKEVELNYLVWYKEVE